MKKLLLTLSIALAILIPQIAAAQLDLQPSVQAGAEECLSLGICTLCHFIELIDNTIDVITLRLMPIVSFLMTVVGGAYVALSAGAQSLIKKGKTIILIALGAQIAALGAFFIVNFTLASLLGVGYENVQVLRGENNIFGQDTWADYCTNLVVEEEVPTFPTSGTECGEADRTNVCTTSELCTSLNGAIVDYLSCGDDTEAGCCVIAESNAEDIEADVSQNTECETADPDFNICGTAELCTQYNGTIDTSLSCEGSGTGDTCCVAPTGESSEEETIEEEESSFSSDCENEGYFCTENNDACTVDLQGTTVEEFSCDGSGGGSICCTLG